MILQQTPAQPPALSINKVLCYLAAFFGTGIALILLNCFYNALNEYSALIMRILAFSAVVLILSFVAYVSCNIYIIIEYKATENEIFKESRQQLITSDEEPESDDKEQKILSLFDEMTFTNSLSYNQIALDVFGGKSGVYTKQIKDILVKNGREI